MSEREKSQLIIGGGSSLANASKYIEDINKPKSFDKVKL